MKEAARVVEQFATRARSLGSARLDLLITSPGRQSENGEAFARALSEAAGSPARVLTSDEEGALAFLGATAALEPAAGPALVCDVGGGSTQLVTGRPPREVEWCRSLDIGSLRLTDRFALDSDNVSGKAILAAREEAERLVAELAVPAVERAYVTGGTARALHKICGRLLTASEMEKAVQLTVRLKPKQLAADYGLSRRRAERLLGGTLIMEAAQQHVGIPFEVAGGGIREGAILALLEQALAA